MHLIFFLLIFFAVRAAFQRGPSESEEPATALLHLSDKGVSCPPDFSIWLLKFFLYVSGSVVINDRSGIGGNLILVSSNTEKCSLAGVTVTESQESPWKVIYNIYPSRDGVIWNLLASWILCFDFLCEILGTKASFSWLKSSQPYQTVQMSTVWWAVKIFVSFGNEFSCFFFHYSCNGNRSRKPELNPQQLGTQIYCI